MSLLLKALAGQNLEQRPPVWLMRQAGRYLPEYRELRKEHSLLEMFHTTDLIVEVTKQPFRHLNLDAAILFADILLLLEALGPSLDFIDGEGPVVTGQIDPSPCTRTLINQQFAYQHAAIRTLRETLSVPLLGFAGGPFTVAAYLLESRGLKELTKTKKLLYSEPEKLKALLDHLTKATILYLEAQVDAGVQAVQIFDSWAGYLSYDAFTTYALPYLKQIVEAIQPKVPCILFCRGSCLWQEELASTQARGLSLDWPGSLPLARKRLGPKITLQGNLDPHLLLLGNRACIEKETDALLHAMEGDPAFILNLGHGILPQTPLENVQTVVQKCKSLS